MTVIFISKKAKIQKQIKVQTENVSVTTLNSGTLKIDLFKDFISNIYLQNY